MEEKSQQEYEADIVKEMREYTRKMAENPTKQYLENRRLNHAKQFPRTKAIRDPARLNKRAELFNGMIASIKGRIRSLSDLFRGVQRE